MLTINRRRLLQLAAASTPLLAGLDSRAQGTWPEKPIRFVVGYPAGQSVDIFARTFAAAMSKDLGQPIIVDNRAGANGIIGAQEVKQSKPDGYTVLFGTSGQLAINPSLYKKLPYDTVKDFAPVGLILTGTLFLLANPSFPANDLQQLIAYARTRAGQDRLRLGRQRHHGASGHGAAAVQRGHQAQSCAVQGHAGRVERPHGRADPAHDGQRPRRPCNTCAPASSRCWARRRPCAVRRPPTCARWPSRA